MLCPPRLRAAALGVILTVLAALAPVAFVPSSDTSAQSLARNIKQAMLHQQAGPATTFGEPLLRPRARRTPTRYATDHIVVKFSRGVSARALRAVPGVREVVRPRYADFHLVRLAEGQDPVTAAQRLSGEDGVVYAEPDPIVRPLYKPNDPLYSYQWNFQKINMEAAWDLNRGGSTKTTVAVLDTGVAYMNQGAFAQAPDYAGTHFVAGHDFIWNDDTPLDTDGHGTHVTGTIAETTNNNLALAGMAFNVNIMPVKVLASDWDLANGAPNDSTMSVLAQGIRFAVDNGAKVLNMSLGADEPSSTVESAIRYAVSKGAFIAVASGNSGDGDNAPEWPASYAPAIEGVMAVAAVNYNLDRAPYSTHLDYVEIAAPGGNLDEDLNKDTYGDGILQQTFDPAYSDNGIFNRFAYMFYEGTSMATAHVSGMAALLYDQGITSPAAIEAAIKVTAQKKPAGGRNNDIGSGVIDVRAGLRGLGLAR